MTTGGSEEAVHGPVGDAGEPHVSRSVSRLSVAFITSKTSASHRSRPKLHRFSTRRSAPSPKEFRDAVDLLNSGAAAQAAAAFRTYLSRRPPKERAEDATYLLVVALRRCGDDAGAASVARDYLRLYPHALRRREVEGLASSGSEAH